MNRKLSMTALTIIALTVVCAISPVSAETEIFENTYRVEPDAVLELDNRNGGVKIEPWDQPGVKVRAEKKTQHLGKLENVEIRVSTGKILRIETVELVENPRVSVEYEIKAPASLIVSWVHTSNGAIRIEGVRGDMELKTSNGAIRIKSVRGDMKLKTSNGKIEAKHVNGDLTVKTSSGSIRVSDIHGLVKAENSNGSIEITEALGIRGAKTSNGSIEAEIATVDDSDALIKTSNGSITLYVSPDVKASFDMKTSNGKIKLHDDLEWTLGGGASKRKIKGELGGGGPEITVKTSNGNIDLHALR